MCTSRILCVCTAGILNCVYSRNTVLCGEQAYSIKCTVSLIMCTVGLQRRTAVLLLYVYSRPNNEYSRHPVLCEKQSHCMKCTGSIMHFVYSGRNILCLQQAQCIKCTVVQQYYVYSRLTALCVQ